MKKNNIKSLALAIFATVLFVAIPTNVGMAYSTWNGFSNDCPTVTVGFPGTGNPTCWAPSITANAGQTVNVRLYYHNTSDNAVTNTTLRLNQPSGSATSFNFNGSVSGGGSSASNLGPVTINLTSAQTLTLSQVKWFPDRSGETGGSYPLPNGQNGNEIFGAGLNIGTINTWKSPSCPTTDSFCHAGSVVVSFIVSTTTVSTSACSINTFRVNPTNINSGDTSNVIWYAPGCTTVSVTGPGVNGTGASGSLPTPRLYNDTIYTITARDAYGSAPSQSRTVTVNPVIVTPTCKINYFNGPTAPISSGSTATLSWGTTNCNSVSISGLSVPPSQTTGSVTTPALTSTTPYTLTASGATGSPVTLGTTVVVNSVITPTPTCQIQNFSGPTAPIANGSYATLTWDTINCNSVSISGLSVPSSRTSGSISTGILYSSATYTLSATGTNGSDTQPFTITVLPATPVPTQSCQITQFMPANTTVPSNSSTTIYWTTVGCNSITISSGTNNYGGQAASGQMSSGIINGTATFTINASGIYGSAPSQSFSISSYSTPIIPIPYPYPYPYPTPTQTCTVSSFYADPSQVSSGGTTTLIWNTYGCSSVNITGNNLYGYGNQSTSGQITTGAIYGTESYTINAYGSYGNAPSRTISVSVYQQPTYQSSPTVTTYAATGVSDTTATLNGYISSGSGYYGGSSGTYYFQYGTNYNSLYSTTPSQSSSNYYSNISSYLAGLVPNTTYYFRAVAQNSYGTNYGTVLSFVTNGGSPIYTETKVVTSVPTSVGSSSARLNGIVIAPPSYGTANAYFEYGTDISLGLSTSQRPVSVSNSLTNYYDFISTTPNTLYYFRATAVIGGVTYRGSTASFMTPGVSTIKTVYVDTTPGTGTGSKYVMLSISDQFQNISAGDTLSYTVIYKNISNSILTDAVLNVVLPSGVTFKRATLGVPTTNNTVAVNLGTLPKDATGTITIEAVADNVKNGDALISTATLAFTLPSTAQDTAVAYALNNVTGTTTNNSFLAGLALFGVDFFPKTFLGWVFLIGLIILVVALVRRLYPKQQPVMVNHPHATAPHPDNLPH